MSDTTVRTGLRAIVNRAKSDYSSVGYKPTDAQALGILLSKFFQYDGVAILRTAEAALEDANYHTDAAKISLLADQYDPPFDPDALIDADTRSALFAALNGRFGKLDRDARLRKLSVLAGRPDDNPITSLSDRYCDMTMGDARRVFNVLDETK